MIEFLEAKDSVGMFLAKYLLLFGITILVKTQVSSAVNFEYRTGFLTREEKQERDQKIKVVFSMIIFSLPFFIR